MNITLSLCWLFSPLRLGFYLRPKQKKSKLPDNFVIQSKLCFYAVKKFLLLLFVFFHLCCFSFQETLIKPRTDFCSIFNETKTPVETWQKHHVTRATTKNQPPLNSDNEPVNGAEVVEERPYSATFELWWDRLHLHSNHCWIITAFMFTHLFIHLFINWFRNCILHPHVNLYNVLVESWKTAEQPFSPEYRPRPVEMWTSRDVDQ